jgi:hypothetical protein
MVGSLLKLTVGLNVLTALRKNEAPTGWLLKSTAAEVDKSVWVIARIIQTFVHWTGYHMAYGSRDVLSSVDHRYDTAANVADTLHTVDDAITGVPLVQLHCFLQQLQPTPHA